MHFSKIILALLPAVALAAPADDSALTTTHTSTKVLTMTYFLSSVHTVTAVVESSTGTFVTTAVATSVGTTEVTVAPTATEASPTATPPVVTGNAGSALEAGKLAAAGIAGMVALALI